MYWARSLFELLDLPPLQCTVDLLQGPMHAKITIIYPVDTKFCPLWGNCFWAETFFSLLGLSFEISHCLFTRLCLLFFHPCHCNLPSLESENALELIIQILKITTNLKHWQIRYKASKEPGIFKILFLIKLNIGFFSFTFQICLAFEGPFRYSFNNVFEY